MYLADLQSPVAGSNKETELNSHKKIKRIEGIGGHTPAFYCCVCGKSTKKNSSIFTCISECPNVCHLECADSDSVFHCSQVEQLRIQQGITQDVLYVNGSETNITQTVPDSLPDADPGPDRDSSQELVDEPNQHLLQVIRTQKATITQLLKHLAVFTDSDLTLTKLSSAIVSAKAFIADCSINTASIAATARDAGIDAEFDKSSQQNPAIKNWWENTPLGKKILLRAPQQLPFSSQSRSTRAGPSEQSTAAGFTIAANQPLPTDALPPSRASNNHPSSSQMPTEALPPSRASNNHSSSSRTNRVGQEQGRKKQIKNPRTVPPSVCSYCSRRGHTETNCRNRLVCNFCNTKGHARDTCRWKASEDRANTLEQEVRTLISQIRHTSQAQVTHQPQVIHQPQVSSQPQVTHQPQTFHHPQAAHPPLINNQPSQPYRFHCPSQNWSPQNWPTFQWTPTPWLQSS